MNREARGMSGACMNDDRVVRFARMNVKGMDGRSVGVPVVGGVKMHPRDCKRSAEPDEDVEARLPCCNKTNENSKEKHLSH